LTHTPGIVFRGRSFALVRQPVDYPLAQKPHAVGVIRPPLRVARLRFAEFHDATPPRIGVAADESTSSPLQAPPRGARLHLRRRRRPFRLPEMARALRTVPLSYSQQSLLGPLQGRDPGEGRPTGHRVIRPDPVR